MLQKNARISITAIRGETIKNDHGEICSSSHQHWWELAAELSTPIDPDYTRTIPQRLANYMYYMTLNTCAPTQPAEAESHKYRKRQLIHKPSRTCSSAPLTNRLWMPSFAGAASRNCKSDVSFSAARPVRPHGCLRHGPYASSSCHSASSECGADVRA